MSPDQPQTARVFVNRLWYLFFGGGLCRSLDDTGAQLLFRFIAAAYERRALGIASHWPFESWGRFLPEHTTAVSLLDRLLHHANVVVTDGESYRMRQARTRPSRGGAATS